MDTTQNLYLDSVMALANTLTIKFSMAATMRNNYLTQLGYVVDSEQPSTWAYYMNLAGQYHASDTMMSVVSLDTLETIEFTYDNLLLHRATKKAYAFGTSYYNALLQQYPTQEGLIRGILNPVDLATAVAADDWTILYYDPDQVETQEVYLIQDLQTWVTNFTDRWYMPFPAAVQIQYPATFFGILFSHLPGEIINIRNRYTYTPHVHSYHLWSFLGSHGRLNAFKDYATLKQALYLYRNIEFIEAHAGKTSTFVDLIANILTDRRIPLTAYEIHQEVTDVSANIYSTGVVAKMPQNSLAESVAGITYISIADGLSNEVDAAKDNTLYLTEQQTAVPNQAKNAITNTIPTKVLESIMVDQSDAMPRKLSDTLLSEWIYLACNKKYVANIIVTNPANEEAMSMTVREALIVWIYAVMQQFEMTLTDIPNITAFFAQRIPSPTYSELRACTTTDNVSELGIQVAMTEVTSVTSIISTEAFYTTAVAIQGNYTAHRYMYTSMEDYVQRGEWEVLCRRFYCDTVCTLIDTPTTYEAWFKAKNWDLSLADTEAWSNLALDIFNIATGANLSTTVSVSDIHSAMINIMTQLSSYGVQYIHQTIAAPGVVLDNVSLRFGRVTGKGAGDYQVPFRAEIINRKEKGLSSPAIGAFEAAVIEMKHILAKYRYRPDWGIGFLATSDIKTTHRVPIAELRFKGNLSKDIALDMSVTALNGLWEYKAVYRPLEDVVTTLSLPGIWLYPPDVGDLLQAEVTTRALTGLDVNKIVPDPQLTLANTTLDGLYVKDIPRVQLWQLYNDTLDGFGELFTPVDVTGLFSTLMLRSFITIQQPLLLDNLYPDDTLNVSQRETLDELFPFGDLLDEIPWRTNLEGLYPTASLAVWGDNT